MLGSIIGAGVGAAASIFGGGSATKAMNRFKESLERQKRENRDWYDRRYNEDATQRADAMRILTKTEEQYRNRNAAAQGAAAVMGGSEESVAAAKAENAKALADATSQIAVAGEARKDQIEQQYMAKNSQIEDKLNNLELQKAAEIGKAAQGVGEAASSIGSLF